MPQTRQSDGKFLGYIRLVDACARPGCPVCRYVTDESHSHLDALLYEQVTDPDTRRHLQASWGLCNWHTWMLLEIGSAASSAAILYEDLIGIWLHRVRRLLDRSFGGGGRSLRRFLFGRPRTTTLVELFRRRRSCLACASAVEAETRSVRALLEFITEPEMDTAYARSDGICARHAVRAIEIGAGRGELRHLLDRTLPKWAATRADLERFIRKHDYRNREPFTETEAASYMRAFELLAGAKGVFGNELHQLPISSEGMRGAVSGKPGPSRRMAESHSARPR